ncbi:MAG TPA: FliA/WhiG family RNA polymerase sigma factor [Bryobacteraceae bacterium]|jgi:RNA polymerase sigma factor for flagellar operon FliA
MASLSAGIYSESPAQPSATREELIMEHLPQVRWIASRIHERLSDNTSLEDLISIGIIGLINAIDNFDATLNVKLKTYAEYRIRGAILDSIRGLDGIAPHKRKKLKQVQAALAALEQRLQRAPAEEEIAAELGIGHREYQEWLLELRGVTIGSLDAPQKEGDSRTLMHYIASPEDDSPARLLERAELEKLIQEGLSRMPKVEGLVLDLYYRQGQNIREIAPILDLHITRISQIKAQAVMRLRTYIERRWPVSNGVY